MKQNKDYYELIKVTLNKLPRHICVKFSFFCAKDVFQYVGEKDKSNVKKTLDLVELWLMDSTRISMEELRSAAYYTYTSADCSATSTDAAYAAHYAASTTFVTAHSDYAVYAADAANKNEKYELYYNYLLSMITPLQRSIYLGEY